MFDYVQFNMRLPVEKDAAVRAHGNPFQSKSIRSWELPHLREIACNEGALTVIVDEAGQLYDHTSKPLAWSGTLNFYGSVPRRHKWIEFNADIDGGRVKSVMRV